MLPARALPARLLSCLPALTFRPYPGLRLEAHVAPVALRIPSDTSGGRMLIANVGVKFKIPGSAAVRRADGGRLSKDSLSGLTPSTFRIGK